MFSQKKKSNKKSELKKFKLSENATMFIKKYIITELDIISPINKKMFDTITDLANQWEMDMIDPQDKDGGDKHYDYPERERNEMADKFVSEITGQWDDTRLVSDFDDLNKRLGLT